LDLKVLGEMEGNKRFFCLVTLSGAPKAVSFSSGRTVFFFQGWKAPAPKKEKERRGGVLSPSSEAKRGHRGR